MRLCFLFYSQQTGAPHHLQCPHCRLPSLSPPYRAPHHEGTNTVMLNTVIKKMSSIFPQTFCCSSMSFSFYCFYDKSIWLNVIGSHIYHLCPLSVCWDPVSQFLWHYGQDGGKILFDCFFYYCFFLYLLTLYKNSKQEDHKRKAKPH